MNTQEFWIECLEQGKFKDLLESIRQADSGMYDRGYFFIITIRTAFEEGKCSKEIIDKASELYLYQLQQVPSDY